MASLCERLGHADRHDGLSGYCTGLMLPLSRKSVEPMAARLDPLHVSARHQALHHFVAQSEWPDRAVLGAVRDWVQPVLGLEHGCYCIVDDTGFPKKGQHSVGVARQYCGQLGNQDNCQVAVSLSLASARGSLPVTGSGWPAGHSMSSYSGGRSSLSVASRCAGPTRTAAKPPLSGSPCVPSRHWAVCQCDSSRLRANAMTVTGSWPGARRRRTGLAPRPDHALGASGSVPGAHTVVPGRIPTA